MLYAQFELSRLILGVVESYNFLFFWEEKRKVTQNKITDDIQCGRKGSKYQILSEPRQPNGGYESPGGP